MNDNDNQGSIGVGVVVVVAVVIVVNNNNNNHDDVTVEKTPIDPSLLFPLFLEAKTKTRVDTTK